MLVNNLERKRKSRPLDVIIRQAEFRIYLSKMPPFEVKIHKTTCPIGQVH